MLDAGTSWALFWIGKRCRGLQRVRRCSGRQPTIPTHLQRRIVLRQNPIQPWAPGLSLKGKRKGFVTPTETNLHGDALCAMVKTLTRHKTTEALLNNGWRLAVGDS